MTLAVHDRQTDTLHVLLLEDSDLDAELVTDYLGSIGVPSVVERVVSRGDFVAALDSNPFDLILADYALPAFDGMSALAIAREVRPDTPFIFVSGTLGEEIAVEALKRGATDYVLKQRLERLPPTILRALAEARERGERQRAQAALSQLLDERTALLNELDHRVKNNLQLLLSLVSYDIRQAADPAVRLALGRVKQRMQALGTVHRDLYRNEALETFDAADFVADLASDLLASIGRADIDPEFQLDHAAIPAHQAAPVALLLNEVLSSAMSHAYHKRHGSLRLVLRCEAGTCRLTVGDDVFSPSEKAAARDRCAGPIFEALVRQLEATVEWPEMESDILVRIVFPVHRLS